MVALPVGEVKVPDVFLLIESGGLVVEVVVAVCWGAGVCIGGGEVMVRGSRGGGRLTGGPIFEAEELCRINLGTVVGS